MPDLTTSGQLTVARPIRQREPGERSIISKFTDRVRLLLGRGAGAFGPILGAHGWSDPRWWSDDPDDWPAIVTEADLLGMPPFGRGLDLIASAVAGVDLTAYRYDTTLGIDAKVQPQPEVLRDPDPVTTPWNWKYSVVNDLVLYGNHISLLGPPNANGWPRWLYPVDITTVDLRVDEYGYIEWRVDGETYPYGSVLHISSGNRSGYILGRGAINQYRDSLGGVKEIDRHAGRYFRRGGLPSAVLRVTDPDLKPEQAQAIKDRYMDTIGRANGREPLVVPGHYEFTPVASDADKQQLVEARTWDATLVAMILGIPSHYLGLQGPSMTYSNIETADIGFVRDTVNRWAKPIEAAVTKWLLPNGQSAEFNWSDRLRADSKTRAEVIGLELANGTLTRDEARQMYGREPLPEPESAPVPLQLVANQDQPVEDEQEQVENE